MRTVLLLLVTCFFLIAAWGEQGGEADLDQNGVVAVADLLMLIANWGTMLRRNK